jgi:hypothetical protein
VAFGSRFQHQSEHGNSEAQICKQRDEFGKLLGGVDFKVERTHPPEQDCDTVSQIATGTARGCLYVCGALAPINPSGYSHKLHVSRLKGARGVFVRILIAKTAPYLCVSIKYSVEIRCAPAH